MRAFGCHVIYGSFHSDYLIYIQDLFQPPSYLVLSLILVIDQIDGPEKLEMFVSRDVIILMLC